MKHILYALDIIFIIVQYLIKTPHIRVATAPGRVTEHRWGKWPLPSKDKQWLQFDDDVNNILEISQG